MSGALIAALLVGGLLLAAVGSTAFVAVLEGWSYSSTEIVIATALPGALGALLGSSLKAKYWKGFAKVFVGSTFAAFLLLKLKPLMWSPSLYALLFCCGIMFGSQCAVMYWRSIGSLNKDA